MKDKEKDKRLLIPGDAFNEEASEGLGQLSREEAEADLRELKGRLVRRISRPRAIWLPAAAAVVVLLVASALYVSIFRERSPELPGIARSERGKSDRGGAADAEKKKGDSALIAFSGEEIRDTALITMAATIEKKEMEAVSTRRGSLKGVAGAASEEKPSQAVISDEKYALNEMVVTEDEVIEVAEAAQHEEPAAEELIVGALPMMQRAALRTEDTARAGANERTDASSKEKAVVRQAAVTSESARPATAGYEAVKPTAAGKDVEVQDVVLTDRSTSPVGGWDEYQEWMARNIKYPEGIEPAERREVMVSFIIRPDSTISEMKALRSPGEAFTREAFRILREGPKWIPVTQNGKVMNKEIICTFVFK